MTERATGMEAREEQVTMEPLLSPGKAKARVKAARFQVRIRTVHQATVSSAGKLSDGFHCLC